MTSPTSRTWVEEAIPRALVIPTGDDSVVTRTAYVPEELPPLSVTVNA